MILFFHKWQKDMTNFSVVWNEKKSALNVFLTLNLQEPANPHNLIKFNLQKPLDNARPVENAEKL